LPLVAVSAWKEMRSGDHVVVMYRGSEAVWEAVRVIGGGFGGPGSLDGQLKLPLGLRFSGDGFAICVADYWNGRASVLRVGDGGFVRHMATGLSLPWDVEEVEDGWLMVSFDSHTVEFVGDGGGGVGGGRPSLGKARGGLGTGERVFCGPVTLAVAPGLGLVVRDADNRRLQVFATPDAIAMATMPPARVAWMAVVARGVLRRLKPSGVAGEGRDPTARGKKRARGSRAAPVVGGGK
jgi:hypothetical protein